MIEKWGNFETYSHPSCERNAIARAVQRVEVAYAYAWDRNLAPPSEETILAAIIGDQNIV